jgi:hypothetical protein
VARTLHVDGGETPPGARYLTDLDRLEDYSATHAETFEELGNWPADRFEAAWDAYRLRETLADVNAWEQGMIQAMHANGMLGGDDFSKQIDSIHDRAEALRGKLLGADPEIEEEQLGVSAPYPATAEAEPDGP